MPKNPVSCAPDLCVQCGETILSLWPMGRFIMAPGDADLAFPVTPSNQLPLIREWQIEVIISLAS